MNNGIDVFINITDDECILCLNHIDPHNSERLHCDHHFCRSCIHVWYETNHECPLCHNNMAIVLWDSGVDKTDNQIQPWNNDIDDMPDIDIDSYQGYPHFFDYKSTSELKVYAVNYNILRIMSGLGGLSYSN